MNSSTSSFAQISEQSLSYQNLLSLKPQLLSRKLELLFSVIPPEDEYLKLFETCNTKFKEWGNSELLLLQLLVLSTNPDCIANKFDWEKIQRLYPRSTTIEELYFKFQSFYKCQLARSPWSSFEDQALFDIITKNCQSQKKRWNQIAAYYNQVSSSEVKRNAKQCRERWNNKLDPHINREPMSVFEEQHFLQLLLQYGRKWADISLRLSTMTNFKRRTEFLLKHKYKLLQKYCGKGPSKMQSMKFRIHPSWNDKQVNMILHRLEHLNLIHSQKNREIVKLAQLESFDQELFFGIVIMKKNKILERFTINEL